MPRYTVLQPVEHDHVRVESGEIELSDAAAAPLITIGAIVGPVTAVEGESSTRVPVPAGATIAEDAPPEAPADDAPPEAA